MNEQPSRRFTSDEIVSVVFGMTTEIEKPAGLMHLFKKPVRTALLPLARPIPLHMATTALVRSGMKGPEALRIQNTVLDIMAEHLGDAHFKAHHRKTDFTGSIQVNKLDWSPQYFLGVQISDPKMDLSQEQEILVTLKERLKEAIDRHMHMAPGTFVRRAVLSGEKQILVHS